MIDMRMNILIILSIPALTHNKQVLFDTQQTSVFWYTTSKLIHAQQVPFSFHKLHFLLGQTIAHKRVSLFVSTSFKIL